MTTTTGSLCDGPPTPRFLLIIFSRPATHYLLAHTHIIHLYSHNEGAARKGNKGDENDSKQRWRE